MSVEKITAYIKGIFDDFIQFFEDLPVNILDGILSAIAFVIESIPVPDILEANSLQQLISTIHPDVAYFLAITGFPECVAVIGSGYLFRTLRRLLTLGIW